MAMSSCCGAGCTAPTPTTRARARITARTGLRPALGQLAGGVLNPQQRPLDSGLPPGLRAGVPAFGVGADAGGEGAQVLLQSLTPCRVHGLAHLVSDLNGYLSLTAPLDDHPSRWPYREVTNLDAAQPKALASR